MRYKITLTAVENNHPITPETDPAFLRTCQQAICWRSGNRAFSGKPNTAPPNACAGKGDVYDPGCRLLPRFH